MKQSDTERPSRDPSGVGVVELGEDVFGAVAAVLRDGEDGDDNGKHSSKGPEDGKGLFSISNTRCKLKKEPHIEPRQPAVSEGGYQVAKEGDAKENQVSLPSGTGEDANAGLGFEHVDACTKEQGSGEVDGEGNGNVSHYKGPSADPRCDSAVGRRRQHEGLVVNAAAGGVDARDLTQRSSHTENDQRDAEPPPDDADGPCTGDGVEQGRRQTVGHRGQDEGHEGDLEGRPGSHQLGLVAHGLQQVVGIVARTVVAGHVLAQAHLASLLGGGARVDVVLSGIRIRLRAVAVVGHGGMGAASVPGVCGTKECTGGRSL
jgi:hypothetical protein